MKQKIALKYDKKFQFFQISILNICAECYSEYCELVYKWFTKKIQVRIQV